MDNRRRLRRYLIVTILIVVFSYGLWRAGNLILGPNLTIIEPPQEVLTANDSLFTIAGKTKRISKIFLNDRQIFTTDDGNFRESLLLSVGYNIIKVRVIDRFGREIIKRLEVVLQ